MSGSKCGRGALESPLWSWSSCLWHDGKPWDPCEGCTFFTAQAQRPAYLHSRDVTLAVFCEGTHAESRPYADFVENHLPWYSARDADTAGWVLVRFHRLLPPGRRAVYETYWSTGRGTEPMAWSYALLDGTVYGRQEVWEDSPEGWPHEVGTRGEQFRIAGRPTIQWSVSQQTARARVLSGTLSPGLNLLAAWGPLRTQPSVLP